MHDRRWRAGIAVAWIVGISWFAIESQKPPPASPLAAPEGMFSAARAHKYVGQLAQAPHPPGSVEAKQVRAILLREFARLGLEAHIQIPNDPAAQGLHRLARLHR